MQNTTFESKEQLENRLKEIENQVNVLFEEKDEILLKLQAFGRQKHGNIQDSISSDRKENAEKEETEKEETEKEDAEKGEAEKEVKMIIEDSSLKKSAMAIKARMEKLKEKERLKRQKYLKMTNLDSLREYFENEWDIDTSEYSTYTSLEQDASELEKKAKLKTLEFQFEECIEFFDIQIVKTGLTKEQYNLPPDQLKLVAEPFFEAMIQRSKVVDLYENCAIKSGKLSGTTSLGISQIQTCSTRATFLISSLGYFLDYKNCFDWNYDKLKGVFSLWEAGFCSLLCHTYGEEVNNFSGKLLSLLKKEEIQLTEDQKKYFMSIIIAVDDLVEKGWWDQRYRNTDKYHEYEQEQEQEQEYEYEYEYEYE